jgi:glutathione S-transferase
MKILETSVAPNGRRVRIFLAEKGVEVTMEQVDIRAGENLGDEFLAKNPFGRIPVLELDDGSYLAESVAICRYFEGLHPQPPLFGTDPLTQASIEMWNRRAELNFMMPAAQAFRNITGVFKDRETVVPEWGQVSAGAAADALKVFDTALAERDYLAGEFSVADITFAVAVDFAQAVKLDLPFDLPNLARYREQVGARTSFSA